MLMRCHYECEAKRCTCYAHVSSVMHVFTCGALEAGVYLTVH